MPSLTFELTLPAPLESVWSLYNDPAKALPLLTPPDLGLTLDQIDLPIHEGSLVTLHHKGPLGRTLHWTTRITTHRPPHSVVFGQEARFTDRLQSGPFAHWQHDHEFEALDAKTTRLVDRITYRLPWHPLTFPLDLFYVRPRLKNLFHHRHQVTRAWFSDTKVANSG